jgi:hypothetical protein
MPNLFTTSDHENPPFCLSFAALELSLNRAGLYFAYIRSYLRTTFCVFIYCFLSFYVQKLGKTRQFPFLFIPLWAFPFLVRRGVLGASLHATLYCRRERVNIVPLFPLTVLCVLVASGGGGKPVETVDGGAGNERSKDTRVCVCLFCV